MSQDRKLTLFYHFNKVAGHRTLEQLIQAIQGNHFKDQVARIRLMAAKGKSQQASNLKKQLPAFTVSGHFNGGRTLEHLVEYTHFIVLDFDKLEPAQLEKLKSESRSDRFSVAGFTSPSGNGYKIVVQVDSDQQHHADAFRQVSKYYTELLSPQLGGAGGGLDRSGKDITRLCFLSHDPDAWFDPNKEVFPVLLFHSRRESVPSQSVCHPDQESEPVLTADCHPHRGPAPVLLANEQKTTLNAQLQ